MSHATYEKIRAMRLSAMAGTSKSYIACALADEATLLFKIIHRRHKRKSTILYSQFAPAGRHQRISQETLADAILDRIVHDSYLLHLKTTNGEPSMRQKYGMNLQWLNVRKGGSLPPEQWSESRELVVPSFRNIHPLRYSQEN